MTLTSPSPGPRPARRRRVAAWLAACAAVAALALTPLAATAAQAPAAAPSDPAGSVGVSVAPSAGGLVQADQPLTVTVSVTNTTPSTVAPADVRVEVGRDPLDTRSGLGDWLAGDVAGVALDAFGTTRVESVAPLGTQTTAITIDPVATELTTRSAGVYPLRAVYETDAGPLAVASVVTVPPPVGAPASVGVVVPIVAGPLDEGLLTAAELTELTGPLGALTAQLDAVAGTPAILAVDPAIPAAIRVLGASAPDDARLWLERLLSLPNSRFALQFGDADLATQIQAGVTPLLAPTALDPYLRAEDFAPKTDAATPEPTPAPTPTDASPVLPTLAELTDIGPARAAAFWPATGTAGADVVAALAGLDPASPILVPSATTSANVGARATAGGAELLVYDSDVSASLTASAATEDGVVRAAALAETAAYAALARQEAGDRPLLVVLDRGGDRSRLGLRSAIAAATTLPGYAATDLGTLTAASAYPVEVSGVDADTARVDALTQLLADESELAGFATILADPAVLTTPERTAILQVMGSGWRARGDAWTTAVADHHEQTRQTLDAVGINPPSNINLLGSTAPLGFAVRNDLPWPVSLVLTAYPTDPVLIVQTTSPVEAGAEQNTRVEVPVEARVGSGTTAIDLQLRSQSGILIGEPRSVAVTVRAEWESVWVAVLAAGVGLLLVLGIVRTVLRVRRRAPGGADAATADAAAAPGPNDGASS